MDRKLLEHLNLEDDLVLTGIMTPDDAASLESEEEDGDKIARLLKEGRVTEDTLLDLVAQKLKMPYMDVSESEVEPSVLSLISVETARKYSFVPLFRFDNTLSIAVANPHDVAALDAAEKESGCEIEPILSSQQAIAHLIDESYGKGEGEQETFDQLSDQALPGVGISKGDARGGTEEDEGLSNAPVVKIVDLLLRKAVSEEASDVHLEPEDKSLRVRFRIDGRLREMPAPNWQLYPSIVSRIKILADMDIAEKRLPQDGRFGYRNERHAADIRVSTYPTAHGESVVLRILDKARHLLNLEDLGFDGHDLERYERVFKRPYGILLVTGPTGSGKTTTLYATLSSLRSPEKNMMTLEDPIELRLSGVRQTQVNFKAGLTFGTGLKAILRQDPDVIMVGEIRDQEALDMAIRSAMTGHLVLSTLHTNDAPSGIVRLVNMGAEPFLVASTVIGLMAQRLIRRICPNCRVEYEPSSDALDELKQTGWTYEGPYYEGRGCNACRGMGYRGRIGIFELMILTEEVERLVVDKAPASTIARVAREQGMTPLRDAALSKVSEGITTLEEVFAVTTSSTSS